MSFVSALLRHEVDDRLGSGATGKQDIKSHAFMAGIPTYHILFNRSGLYTIGRDKRCKKLAKEHARNEGGGLRAGAESARGLGSPVQNILYETLFFCWTRARRRACV